MLQISILNLLAFQSNVYIDRSCFIDQVTADNTIPLSPQWLYAKPVDAKSSTTGAPGVCNFTRLKLDVRIDWLVFGYLFEVACFFMYLFIIYWIFLLLIPHNLCHLV